LPDHASTCMVFTIVPDWSATITSGSLFAVAGALLWLFVRADEPMAEDRA
jgi:hypothetical protein